MRFHRTLPQGSTLEITSFFLNRSLTSRMLILGLPLLAAVLLLIFLSMGSGTGSITQRAISRNIQIQTQATGLALEQSLMEARNQLLILAAGSMEQQEMAQRLKIRIQAEGLRYREIAFAGLTPQSSYLLLNLDGEVVSVPWHIAQTSSSSPFQSMGEQHIPAGSVSASQPVEVGYSLLPVRNTLHNVLFSVIRFITPVHDGEGKFQGYLLLSVDLSEPRDIMSRYTTPDASFTADETSTRVRSVFFDREGWMLFQSEEHDETLPHRRLSTEIARIGFTGNFGRPGFAMAFRPGPEYLGYWDMVANVQQGRSGQQMIQGGKTAWGDGQTRVEQISYAPVVFRPDSHSPPVIFGGLALLDTGFAATRTGVRLLSFFAMAFAGGMILLGASLWWLARQMGKSLVDMADELQRRNEQNRTAPLLLPRLPVEMEAVKGGINTLLQRLHSATARHHDRQAEVDAQWQREPATDLPHPEDLPVSGLVGTSPPVLALCEQVRRAAQVMADVLIVGETGTGKELVSEAIHRLSARADGPFITINCGALDENLLMDTLFGHVKGAFTEAKAARKGAFLAAEGGTLMLDEVGNAAPKVQQALLRALSTRHIRPLGSDHEVPFDTRIIAATNAALLEGAVQGSFREDLYYRLAVITLYTPPLRERKTDIPALAVHFLHQASLSASSGGDSVDAPRQPESSVRAGMPGISRGALGKLMGHHWPGNVRELKNTLTRALTFCDGKMLYAEDIQLGQEVPPQEPLPPPRMPQENAPQTGNPPPSAAGEAALPETEEAAPPSAPQPSGLPHDPEAVPALAHSANRRIRELWPHIAARGSVSRQEYQEMAGEDLSVRTAQYDLQTFVKLGLLRKEGRGPAMRYTVYEGRRTWAQN